jgi:cytoskeletal protein CcmA (bactofilin family)
MLETFRKRDNPPVNPRAPGSAPPPVRQPLTNPQVRINETKNEATQAESASPAADASATVKPPEQPQPQPQAQPQVASHASSGGTARLIVGAEIKLKGAEINDCDTLIVEGQVDASMTSRVIEVTQTGLFRGKVQVDFAEIQGRFEGELTANKQLMIRSSGRVSGKIRYGTILIEEGGELSGDVAVAEGSSTSWSRTTSATPESTSESTAHRDSVLTSSLNRMSNSTVATQR